MNIEQIKEKVKQAYTDVDSIASLEKQIEKGVERHRRNYREFKALNPDKDFAYWKKRNEEININSTNNSEVIAMGIFLLALDKFQPDE
ncbi:hypothetical protein [Chryseobacterium flavum]|uniref:hypothetical protein n=1 Tax=Chryseobacterium flavum TaxID=415851 RepID=UPI0028AEAA3B|nr:hypothetical protein [Chryseobacterium flavum]